MSHHLLLSHAQAVKIYREKYQVPGGEIGIDINAGWGEPWDAEDPADVEAVAKKAEWEYGQYADPIFFGKYPDIMVKLAGDRLPKFTEE